MRALTDREKRTIRIAGVLIGAYLVLFYGARAVRSLEGMRSEHLALRERAEGLKQEVKLEEAKAARLAKLRETLRIDLASLREETVVGEACAAIQKAAQAQGVELGPTKETPRRSTGREIGSIQIEGQGGAVAAAQFISGLGEIGFPVAVDAIQFRAGAQPGRVTFSLNVAVLNFAGWKPEEKSGA